MKMPLRTISMIGFAFLIFSSVATAQKAIDTSDFDIKISAAEIKLKENPDNARNKKMLAGAYTKRGLALIEAAQYRAALGDFRRALRYDRKNREAKRMHDQIIGIYKSMNREPPKPGKEPPPLPFKKKT